MPRCQSSPDISPARSASSVTPLQLHQNLDGLRANATTGLEDARAGRVGGVVVQQVGEGAGLVEQALRLPGRVAVDVSACHDGRRDSRCSGGW